MTTAGTPALNLTTASITSTPTSSVKPPRKRPGCDAARPSRAATVGSSEIWMGETVVPPATGSGNHHHGKSETGIYVVQGHPEFVFLEGEDETRLKTSPGDYVYVPPWVPHREENPDPNDEAVVVIARSTQEAIVVNLDDLVWVGPVAVGQRSPDQRTWHEC